MTGFHDPDAGRDVARYLGLTLREVGDVRTGGAEVEGEVTELAHLVRPDGTLSTGALAGLADSVGGLCGGLAVLPGWVVSTNLVLRAWPTTVAGPLSLHAEVRRAGRSAVVTEIEAVDAGSAGHRLAIATLTCAVLQPADGPPVYDRPLVLEAPRLEDPPPIREYLAVTTDADGTIRLPVRDELRNPWGILHGAVTAALVDLAATSRAPSGTGTTTDMVLHFLRPGRVGPVLTVADVVGVRSDGALVRVELRDAGADDRLLAIAVTTVR